LPYLDLFIADKLSLPVSYFNPLRNVSLGKGLNTAQLQQNSCYTAELVGLALRETGSCPAEVILDAPTLALRSDVRRKRPYYIGALVAWTLLFVCVGLYYYQQTTMAEAVSADLVDKSNGVQKLAPEISRLAKEEASLRETLEYTERLGAERDALHRILTELNDKIPRGVWFTEFTPMYDPTHGSGRHGTGGLQQPTDEINVLIINGLYHSNDRTEQVSPQKLLEFINDLAALPDFDIDKNNISETMPTNGGVQGVFAQQFTLHLKLKEPISLRP